MPYDEMAGMAGGAPPAPGGMPPEAAPSGPQGAPMAQPTPNAGANQMAGVQVESAMSLLMQALGATGPTSKEGKILIQALGVLSKAFNEPKTQDLVPAQMMELMRSQSPSGMAQALMQGAAQGQGGGAPPQPPM